MSASPSAVPSPTVVGAKPGMFAYVQASSSGDQMWVANADGTGARQLAQDLSGVLSAPAWSPDGTRLVFSQAPTDFLGPTTGPSRLYMTDASGGAPQLVDTGCVAPCLDDSSAAFSSDGTRLVFVRTYGAAVGFIQGSGLATIELSSGRVTELASTTVSRASGAFAGFTPQDYSPRWSHDGTQIVFSQDVPHANPSPGDGGPIPALFVVDADGRNLRKISPSAQSADWSPDGTRIAFGSVSYVSGTVFRQYYDVYTIRPDGTDLRRLTTDRFSKGPSWTADGRIGFVRVPMVNGDASTGDPVDQLWVMDADGSNASQLTVSPQVHAAGLGIAWPPQL
jgi:Tol biopolymer transport system component